MGCQYLGEARTRATLKKPDGQPVAPGLEWDKAEVMHLSTKFAPLGNVIDVFAGTSVFGLLALVRGGRVLSVEMDDERKYK